MARAKAASRKRGGLYYYNRGQVGEALYWQC